MMTAALDPFRNVSKASDTIWTLARRVWAITRPSAASIWIGRGWDTAASGSTEHHSGRALDIMVSAKVGRMPTMAEAAAGEQMVAWLIRHADQMHTRHIIWNRRIWKRRYRGTATEWSPLTGRSGISDWHEDHIHVYLDDTAGSIPDAPLVPDGTIPARPIPTPPSPEEDDIMATPAERQALISELLGTKLGRSDVTVMQALQESVTKAHRPGDVTVDLLGRMLGSSGPAVGTAIQGTYIATRRLEAQAAALAALVEAGGREGLDVAALSRIADEAAERALAKLGEQLSA